MRLDPGCYWILCEIGFCVRLDLGWDWTLGEIGPWVRLDLGWDWIWGEIGFWVRLDLGWDLILGENWFSKTLKCWALITERPCIICRCNENVDFGLRTNAGVYPAGGREVVEVNIGHCFLQSIAFLCKATRSGVHYSVLAMPRMWCWALCGILDCRTSCWCTWSNFEWLWVKCWFVQTFKSSIHTIWILCMSCACLCDTLQMLICFSQSKFDQLWTAAIAAWPNVDLILVMNKPGWSCQQSYACLKD